jgi:hypothetical protein
MPLTMACLNDVPRKTLAMATHRRIMELEKDMEIAAAYADEAAGIFKLECEINGNARPYTANATLWDDLRKAARKTEKHFRALADLLDAQA